MNGNGMNLGNKELNLIQQLRRVAYGRVAVALVAGELNRIIRIEESIKL